MHNEFRHTNLPDRIVVTPAGDTFRNQRKLYHTILSKSASATFHKGSNLESLLLVGKLLDSPSEFRFHCERFAINVVFQAIYGRRLGDEEDGDIADLYDIWKTMYLCKRVLILPICYP